VSAGGPHVRPVLAGPAGPGETPGLLGVAISEFEPGEGWEPGWQIALDADDARRLFALLGDALQHHTQ